MKKLTGLRMVYIITMIMFAILTITFFYYLSELYQNDLANEERMLRAQAVSFRVEIEERLSAIDDQLLETVSRVPLMGLDHPTDWVRMLNRKEVSDSFTQQTGFMENLDCIFLSGQDGEFMIRAVNPHLTMENRVELLLFLSEYELEYSPLSDNGWMLIELGSSAYFYKAYQVGGYLVGAFSRVDGYTLNLSQPDYAWWVEQDNHCFYSNYTNANENAEIFDSLSLLTVEEELSFCSGILRVSVVNNNWNRYRNNLVTGTAILWFSCMVVAFFQFLTIREKVKKPIKELIDATEIIQKGDYTYQIEETGDPDFRILKSSLNRMIRTIVDLRIDQYEKKVQLQEQEMKILRQQLKPHFYLNAITVIKGMTYQNENEKIREYIMALNVHIRYMLKNNGGVSTIREEFEHLASYIDMQKIKFPDSIVSYISCQEEVYEQQVPHLMLYTIAENAFKYAMGYQMPLILFVQCEEEDREWNGKRIRGVQIEYEDNGPGFPDEFIRKFSDKQYDNSSGISIGLSNLARMLQLMYAEKADMCLENSEPHGARIIIWIPLKEGENSENFDRR